MLKRLSRTGLLAGLVVLFVVGALLSPAFLSVPNQLNILRQAAFVGIIACGMTYVILAGEIDISVGSLVALSSALLGVMMTKLGYPLPVAILAVLVVGMVSGLLTGLARVFFGVPSFISTLALYLALRGLAQIITGSLPIVIDNPVLRFFGNGRMAGIPVQVIILLAVFAIAFFVSRKTTFGRSIYAIGGNAKAARLAGIPVDRVRILIFVITGVLAAFVGILLSARLEAGNANIATGLEFEVIAAVIVGGTSLAGGHGGIAGTFLGVLFITVLSNILVLLGVDPFAQDVVRGAIVLLAVLIANIQTGETRKD
ncbi:ABC transporter permease [Martelella mediterranea]|uniref:ABC transporter permease n=1 Tax=Martelella mediterranea TaxID=293089 RepID=UPI001E2CA9A2|nr:ABC transporter permease [Martelella mediterranea]MCD1635778.1 ABC transporter permease [Martelella mediterranea]